jgi:hypothetical protein
VWNVLGRSSIRTRRATFRSHFLFLSWSMTQIQIVGAAVCHWIPSAHQHSSTPRSVRWSPVLRHTCPHQTPHCIKLIFPVCHLFCRWRHYFHPATCRVTLHSVSSSHFARLFSSTSLSFYKICLAPGLRVTYAFLSTPICAYTPW